MKNGVGGVWISKGILPYYLNGRKLALALLLKEKPMSRAQLLKAIAEKGTKCNQKEIDKMLASLSVLGVVFVADGVYACNTDKLKGDTTQYTEGQLLDLIGMTQGAVNGKAFYSSTPPMSVNSRGSSDT